AAGPAAGQLCGAGALRAPGPPLAARRLRARGRPAVRLLGPAALARLRGQAVCRRCVFGHAGSYLVHGDARLDVVAAGSALRPAVTGLDLPDVSGLLPVRRTARGPAPGRLAFQPAGDVAGLRRVVGRRGGQLPAAPGRPDPGAAGPEHAQLLDG